MFIRQIQLLNKSFKYLKFSSFLKKQQSVLIRYWLTIPLLKSKHFVKPTILVTLASLSLISEKKKVKMSEENTELTDVLTHADQLYDENHYHEAYELLKKFNNQELVEIKWRISRSLFTQSKNLKDKNKKHEMILEGYQTINEALALNDKHYAVHKWLSVLLDAKSEIDGIKERVSQLENVKKHMELAVEYNPNDATSWYLLGSFAFGLADMPWYQRKVVSAIFATPPTGTYEEALDYFLKAEETRANFYSMNHLMIGKCYYTMKQNEKALEYLTVASNWTVLNDDDKKCKEEAIQLLKKL